MFKDRVVDRSTFLQGLVTGGLSLLLGGGLAGNRSRVEGQGPNPDSSTFPTEGLLVETDPEHPLLIDDTQDQWDTLAGRPAGAIEVALNETRFGASYLRFRFRSEARALPLVVRMQRPGQPLVHSLELDWRAYEETGGEVDLQTVFGSCPTDPTNDAAQRIGVQISPRMIAALQEGQVLETRVGLWINDPPQGDPDETVWFRLRWGQQETPTATPTSTATGTPEATRTSTVTPSQTPTLTETPPPTATLRPRPAGGTVVFLPLVSR